MPQCLAQSPMRRLTFPDQFCTPRSALVYFLRLFLLFQTGHRSEFVLGAFADVFALLFGCLAFAPYFLPLGLFLRGEFCHAQSFPQVPN